ncbi:MAG TPA: histidine kinase dimerization/phospho-acceptor domain-containing protein [Acidobacteriota bacterium]|nr:hypothetical protein [Acidobacteriota bacterium]HOT01758.1 histidine kinase dimerization/phospho-acceptor domain-containing protein [Acidobacteriota bacterium]HQF86861.1 histidine kinase dimerization/phospho-acceptor domain-containing protein [Acidobacteriota bacterium]HQG91341.1 histidine kinase dimerization/phospho-acceptor domain-containing protein [Acidobacteriota bacterium]
MSGAPPDYPERLRRLRHDLNTPLTTIRGQIDLLLLQEKQLSPGARRRIERILISCEEIVRLLNDNCHEPED